MIRHNLKIVNGECKPSSIPYHEYKQGDFRFFYLVNPIFLNGKSLMLRRGSQTGSAVHEYASITMRDRVVRTPVRKRARVHASSRDSTYSNLFTVLEDDSVTGNDLDLLHHLLLYTIVRLCTAT